MCSKTDQSTWNPPAAHPIAPALCHPGIQWWERLFDVKLLDIRGEKASIAEKDRLRPVVRLAVKQRLASAATDYGDHATMLELAVLGDEAYALHLANALKARLTVVHVNDDGLILYGEVDQLMTEVTKEQFVAYIKNSNDAATRRIIDGCCRKAFRAGIEPAIVVASGRPEEKIVAVAQAKAADLLVIGNGSRSDRRLALSSGIAGKIIKNSPCAVFTAVSGHIAEDGFAKFNRR